MQNARATYIEHFWFALLRVCCGGTQWGGGGGCLCVCGRRSTGIWSTGSTWPRSWPPPRSEKAVVALNEQNKKKTKTRKVDVLISFFFCDVDCRCLRRGLSLFDLDWIGLIGLMLLSIDSRFSLQSLPLFQTVVNWGLISCAFGIYVCYSLYGLAQEEMCDRCRSLAGSSGLSDRFFACESRQHDDTIRTRQRDVHRHGVSIAVSDVVQRRVRRSWSARPRALARSRSRFSYRDVGVALALAQRCS